MGYQPPIVIPEQYHGEDLTEVTKVWQHPNRGQKIYVELWICSGSGAGSGFSSSGWYMIPGADGSDSWVTLEDGTEVVRARGGRGGKSSSVGKCTASRSSNWAISSSGGTANYLLPFGNLLQRNILLGGYSLITRAPDFQESGCDGEIVKKGLVVVDDLHLYVGTGGPKATLYGGNSGDYNQPGVNGFIYIKW